MHAWSPRANLYTACCWQHASTSDETSSYLDHYHGNRVDYTAEEARVWGLVLRQLHPLLARHACARYNAALPLFDFREDRVPQLQARRYSTRFYL